MEKNKFMMIIIIALLVLMMGTIVGVSLYILNLVNNQTQEADGTSRDPQAVKKLKVEEKTEISLGDPLSTNLQKGADGKDRFVKFSVSVYYDNTQKKESDDLYNILFLNVNKMRSIALNAAFNKTADELNHPDGFVLLANEIKDSLQSTFETNLIVEVDITEHLVN